ncbi:unnamed protein product [Rotaria magnacalcarata]|uniref:Potassium channel tetramerisation-type BTB domain-containing protein n=1 Tax=Rotaria magnacalcarata TaxID=392030 RepID=A0A819FIN4_9BILA|nr:unnamed protein product [Rotaria magnacalcarata]
MDSRTDKSNENGEHRSFNVLGKSFQIRINDLARYPTSLLADNIRLQEYWRPSLHAYFFSRDVRIFESIILPFYTKFKSWERIKRPSMILLSEKRFQNELAFYNLLEYYQIDDILNNIFEHCTQSSSIVFLFSRLLIQKCLCQCIIDCISCVSCAMGICELMLWRCRDRSISLLVTDIFISLILLWTLFYEQYSDKILLKIQFDMHSTWYFIMALALRHLLLIRLCLRDMYHLVDLLCYSGRLSFRVFSHFLLFLATVTFMCIWIGIILYVTDSSSMTNYSIDHRTSLTPSRYIYFVYHILLNVGYGDTVEQSILSFIMIIIMTLVACPLLIIIYRNLIQELNIVKTKMSHVETLHRTSFINHLRTKINSYHKSIVN